MPRRTTKQNDPTIAVGYIRVSTDDQNLGPDAQRAAMAAWCETHGVTLAEVHADHGVSGGAPVDKRPGLLAAVDALPACGAGLLLVAKRDRLARDVVVCAMAERLAEREGARVVSAAGEGTDGADGDPASLLMRRMVDAFAEYERAIIRARTRAALAVKKARGERVGHVPFGYRVADDGVHLVEDEDEQNVLGIVAEYRREGLSLRSVGERLTRRGILPRSGGKWHAQTVARVARSAERAA